MRRILVTAVLVFAVAPVAASVAAGGTDATKAASATCAAQKAKIGATSFAQAYTSFGACVSAMTSLEQQNIASAQTLCAAEQADPIGFAAAHAPKTFAEFYGSGKSDKNALGKCVSTKAQASSKAEQLARTNPARTCRTLRTQLGTRFAPTYGNARNVFGKCISWAANLQTQSENAASATCRTAVNANSAAFATAFGSNADAFGKCVSSNASTEAKAKLQATLAAVTACTTDQTNLTAAAFKSKYGSFKSCVAQNTKTA
jgi:hypothetical protein